MRPRDRARSHSKLALSIAAAAMFAIVMRGGEAQAQTGGADVPQLDAVVEPLRPGVNESRLLAELAAHNEGTPDPAVFLNKFGRRLSDRNLYAGAQSRIPFIERSR